MKIQVVLLLAIVAVHYTAARSVTADTKKVVCYYGSWAVYRPGLGKFDVENIDPFLCTHIVYGFVGLGYDNKVNVLDSYNDLEDNYGKGAMKRFTGLKSKNPNLKALLAIGGWNEGSSKYSDMVSSAASRRTFIDSVLQFLPSQNFDGLDLDWEYPGHRGGKPEDKNNFDLLMAELREEFNKRGYLLTAAVSAGEATIVNAYNIPNMARYLDFISIMAYDFHGAFDGYAHHHSPLYEYPEDRAHNSETFNMAHAVKVWHDGGAPYDKLVLGLGSYGRGFTLDNANNNKPFDPASRPLPPAQYTRDIEGGVWGYNEICEDLSRNQWEVVHVDAFRAPYAVRGQYWIGYDDVDSITEKSIFARDLGLAGVMVWSIETDDFQGTCGETFPLVKAMWKAVNGDIIAPPTPTTTTRDPELPPETTTTTTTTTSRPIPTGEPGNICKKEGFNADPDDCHIFYRCEWDPINDSWHITPFMCGPGTGFSEEKQACDFEQNIPRCRQWIAEDKRGSRVMNAETEETLTIRTDVGLCGKFKSSW
ncbi:unnamed protein product [Allacma fusca]|uniref:Chitinase n=1 Tax=Allacma fusca TaxID=39272 RepID=A0A8J2PLL0_9HEXA|nr:unnamed protein product [Allacma fusca]